jgi:hypothetical protein
MSDLSTPPVPPAPPPPPLGPTRNGFLTIIMFLAGLILLLPGLCALVFGASFISDPSGSGGFIPLVLIGLAIGFGGIMLIRSAIRGLPR